MAQRPCLICTSPITSTHFGLDACRACSLFFKRTKLARRQFICIGEGVCTIRKDDNTTCRKCRFDRCVEVGMAYDGPLRKPKKSNKAAREEVSSSSSLDESPSNSPPIISEAILDRIEREYKKCTDRRLSQEKNLHIIFTLPRVSHPSIDLFQSNLAFSKKSLHITIFECVNFVKKTFPTIGQLTIEEQRPVLNNFVIKFYIIEAHYRTVKLWEDERYYMSSLTTCFDMWKHESWVPDGEAHNDTRNLLGTMKNYAADQFSIIFPTLRKAELNDIEFYGLLAISLCDLADVNGHMSERALKVVDELRTEIFSDLQRYYATEMGVVDQSSRLGYLVTLNQLAKESANLMQEEFRMYTTVFDMYTNDDVLRELML